MCLIILNKVCTMYLIWSQDKHFHNILIVRLFFLTGCALTFGFLILQKDFEKNSNPYLCYHFWLWIWCNCMFFFYIGQI